MTVIPAVTEFLGYAESEKSSKINKTFKVDHRSLPASRVRTATISAIVSDGRTLVLGHLSDDLVVSELNGKEFRQPYIDAKKKQLFVLITPTIIDASGNRVHSDDYYDGPVF
jgi:type II secretory pathway component GspD/PulD (secretin)